MITNAVGIPVQFGGGLNTGEGPQNIADNQSPNCKNVYSNINGILQRRNGFDDIATAGSGTTGHGIFDYWKDAATHYAVGYFDTYLYYIDADPLDSTWHAITFGTAMSDDKMEFEQFNDAGTNYLIMANHSRDHLQKWDGTTCSDLSTDADLPEPKYIKQWKGYLFCANVSSYESRVYYNSTSGAIKDSTDWSSTDYQDIRTNDGDHITGLAILKGRLYTFKRYSIHRWTYFGGTPLFGIKTSVTGVGAVSSKSIVNITHPKYGEILVFLGADARFYAFDGSQVFPISAPIELDNGISEFSMGRLSKAYLSGACAANYEKKRWYVCWVPLTAYNNWCVVWDYQTDAWWPLNGMDARACGTIESGGARNLYFVQDDGKLMQFDYSDSDDGSNIAAIYDTKRFSAGNRPLLKSMKYIDMSFKNIGAIDMSFQYRNDWDNTWNAAETLSMSGGGFILGTGNNVLGTTALGGPEAVMRTVNLPTLSHSIQFRYSTNNANVAWQVYGAELVVSGKGYGRAG